MMKGHSVFIVFLSLLFLIACSEESVVSSDQKYESISLCDSINAIAVSTYNNSDKSIPISALREAGDCYSYFNFAQKAGFTFLNLSTIYDEINDLDSAIYFSHKSKNIYFDEMHQANINKLLGLLYGKKKMIDSSDFYFDISYEQFISADNTRAAAVVTYDKAQVSYYQGEYEKSKSLLEESLSVWREAGVYDRVFVMNTFACELALKMNDAEMYRKTIDENNHLMKQHTDINQRNVDSFMILEQKLDAILLEKN